jgi:hypothetical protein
MWNRPRLRERRRALADGRDPYRRDARVVRVVDPFITHGAIETRDVHSDIDA